MDPKNGYPGWEYQKLFDHMSEQHDLILLQSEMDEIIGICAETIVIIDTQAEQRAQEPSIEDLM